MARAETSCCVKFVIRLWQAEKLIVEVQRTSGCCCRYQQIAKAVLRATRGVSAPAPKQLPMPKCVPPNVDWEQCTIEGLEIAQNSLKGSSIDAHLLALQSLAQLTESCKCRTFAAKSILSSSSEILPIVLSLIQEKPNNMLTDMEQEHCDHMHFQALLVLANCLKNTEVVPDLTELTSQATIVALVNDVSNASSKPHTAAAACRCLQALIKTEACRKLVVELGAHSFTAAANQCRHAVLEEESAKLLEEL